MRDNNVDCLRDSTVLRLTSGTLDGEQAAAVRAHVVECADCELLVAEVLRSFRDDGQALDPTLPAAPPAADDYAPGAIVAERFRVEAVLGRGGMGVVLLAEDLVLHREVALKVLHRDAVASGEARVRFEREARAMAKTASDHVVRVLDVGTLASGEPYLVMERLHGIDLRGYLEQNERAPIALAVDWVRQACSAVARAHKSGIVHRDLKPANLFLAESEGGARIKVLDFGISKLELDAPNPSVTESRAIVGTPLYMSPEQACAAKDVDARADVWSLGVILYELLTGNSPFRRDSLAATLAAILKEDPQRPRDLRTELPAALESIVLRCLAKKPEERIATAEELERALATVDVTPRPQRAKYVVIGALVAALAIGVLFARGGEEAPAAGPVVASASAEPVAPAPIASSAVAIVPSTVVSEAPPRKVPPRPMAIVASATNEPAAVESVAPPPAPASSDPNPEFGGRK